MRQRDRLGKFIKEEFNEYIVKNGIAYVQIDQHTVFFDENDLSVISRYRLCVSHARHATETQKEYYRVQTRRNGKNITIHRLLMNAGKNQIVDHIDQNPLNNCRNNLRFVTKSQNQRNRKARITSSSKFKGCYFNNEKQKWTAQIFLNGKTKHLGHFNLEAEAYSAYSEAEKKYFSDQLEKR